MSKTEQPRRGVRRREDIDETGVKAAVTVLAPQLGSEGTTLQKNQIDMRIMCVINPEIQACMPYIKYRAVIDEVDVFAYVYEEMLYTSPGVGGLGRRQIIQAIAASAGGQKAIDVQERPGWVGRNITERDYKTKAAKEGKEVV